MTETHTLKTLARATLQTLHTLNQHAHKQNTTTNTPGTNTPGSTPPANLTALQHTTNYQQIITNHARTLLNAIAGNPDPNTTNLNQQLREWIHQANQIIQPPRRVDTTQPCTQPTCTGTIMLVITDTKNFTCTNGHTLTDAAPNLIAYIQTNLI